MSDRKRTALLIDCDNVSHNSIGGVLEGLAKWDGKRSTCTWGLEQKNWGQNTVFSNIRKNCNPTPAIHSNI